MSAQVSDRLDLDFFNLAMDAMRSLNATAAEHPRVTTDEAGILMAQAVALRADCTRRRVGAVIVDVHGRVVGTGRNGAPPGRPGCLTDGACPRGRLSKQQIAPGASYATGQAGECISLHAEVNACLFSDPQARRGSTVFVTDAPCDDCAKHIAGSGLARVVWPETVEGAWIIRSYLVDEAPVGGLYR